MNFFFFCLLTLLFSSGANAQSQNITLATLSPHLTELVYSAGAGAHLIGVSAYSDYPETVTSLPIIGDAFTVNQEMLLKLKPDYVLYWEGNIAKQIVSQVNNLGIKTIPVTTSTIDDIPQAIKTISQLVGSKPTKDSDIFSKKIEQLKSEFKSAHQRTALIQISDRPIYTVNNQHWMSEAINICGLNNVFADLSAKSASVNIESIIAKNPDVLIRFSPLKPDETLSQFKQINAIKTQSTIIVNPDYFTRPTLRLLNAIETICSATKQSSFD